MVEQGGTSASTRGKLFGTSGIRGLANEFAKSQLAERLGRTFATCLRGRGTVLVGRDVRLHSRSIQSVLMDNLAVGGLDVVDCGLTPTPALLFALKHERATAGVMVTGSHTPAEIAGVLFFLADTGEMDPTSEKSFEDIFELRPWLSSTTPKRGSYRSVDTREVYYEQLTEAVKSVAGYRVVVDPGNGAACLTLPAALENFGCSVATINGTPDGSFPSRQPNPQPSTLTLLARAVKECRADFGVGTDSDGDRALFATREGRVLWGDQTSALFARNEVNKHGPGTVITTINTSNMVKIVCREAGSRIVVTRVGPPAIAEALRSEKNVLFATEESGKHIWPQHILYADAALSSGKLLELIKEHNTDLQELVAKLPKLCQLKAELECRDELKNEAMNYITGNWRGDGESVATTFDGLKVEYPNLTWFLIRASGTEPLLRCSAEGRDQSEARTLLAKATELGIAALDAARKTVSS